MEYYYFLLGYSSFDQEDFLVLFNPTLHGGAIMAPPINFEASQLKCEVLV